jgi:hypothetical protein
MQSLRSPLDALSEWQTRKNERLQSRQQRHEAVVKAKQAGPVQLSAAQ